MVDKYLQEHKDGDGASRIDFSSKIFSFTVWFFLKMIILCLLTRPHWGALHTRTEPDRVFSMQVSRRN